MITLVFRLMLLIVAVLLYLNGISSGFILPAIVWLHLVIGMMFRLIPNKRISPGARKHFFAPEKPTLIQPKTNIHKGTVAIAIVWIVLNAFIFLLMHLTGLLIFEIALMVLLFYSVCDVAFIQFTCPFRLIFMRNRCCTTCRIYNWDFLMMVTPLILFPSLFSLSLITLAFAVFIRWEYAAWRYPERFAIETNPQLCEGCEAK